MPSYVAFLRGMNLGRRRIKNEELRAEFEALGFAESPASVPAATSSSRRQGGERRRRSTEDGRSRAGRGARLRSAGLPALGQRAEGDRRARALRREGRRPPRASSRSPCCRRSRAPTARKKALARRPTRTGSRSTGASSTGCRAAACSESEPRPEGCSRRRSGHGRCGRRARSSRSSPSTSTESGQVRAGEGGDLGVGADRGDLFRQLGELRVGDELQLRPERAEEVVVVGGDDEPRVEPGEDPPPVVLGEAAAGDAGEEDVDVALADRLVDQVGAALVVEDRARRP